MKIKINNIEEILETNTCLEDFILNKKIELEGIAIAINDKVIPRVEWKKIILKENDRILIITATRGG